MLGVKIFPTLRALEIKRKPFLNAGHAGPLGQIHQKHQVQYNRGCQYAIPAQEVHLDLHGIAHPSKDIYTVPAFLIIPPWGVIADHHLMMKIPVKIRIYLRLKNRLQHRELALFLGLQRTLVIQDKPIPVAEDVRGVPPGKPQHTCLQPRPENGLHKGLTCFKIFSHNRQIVLLSQFHHGRDIEGKVGGAIDIWHPTAQGGIGIEHAGCDIRVVVFQAGLKSGQRGVHIPRHMVYFRTGTPDQHTTGYLVVLFEFFNIFLYSIHQAEVGCLCLDVGTVQVFYECLVKDRRPRFEPFQKGANRLDVFRLEHLCLSGSLVTIFSIDVPSPEYQVIRACKRDKLLYERDAILEPLPQSHSSHLRQRPDGCSQPPAHRFYPSQESGTDCPSHPWDEHTQFPVCLLNFIFPFHSTPPFVSFPVTHISTWPGFRIFCSH